MSGYMTEEEQLEIVKKWWQRYGTTVTIIFSIGLLCVAGYRYMHWHQDKLKNQASITYEHMMNALSHKNNKALQAYAKELTTVYDSTIYADIAHMTLAKMYVTKNKLAAAKEELAKVAQKGHMTALKQIAKIRIARILATEKSYSQALQELSTVDDKIYTPIVNELKGDIYSATAQYTNALNSYRLAINEVKANGMSNLFLEMKNNEVAMKESSMAVVKKI